MPPEALARTFADMGKFNDELVKAGIMVEGDGLKPSAHGKRIRFSDSGATAVVDGPFAETKELVAGYWVWNVKSMEEAVEWAKRCPNPMPGEEGVLEIRPTYVEEDFGELMTPELRAQEERQRKEIARQQKPAARGRTKAKARKKSKPAPARRKVARRKPARAKSKK